jgi:hypothetical protein
MPIPHSIYVITMAIKGRNCKKAMYEIAQLDEELGIVQTVITNV